MRKAMQSVSTPMTRLEAEDLSKAWLLTSRAHLGVGEAEKAADAAEKARAHFVELGDAAGAESACELLRKALSLEEALCQQSEEPGRINDEFDFSGKEGRRDPHRFGQKKTKL